LRLLRMLGCSAALSQERCQTLVGRLQLYELRVDVVVNDGSLLFWSVAALVIWSVRVNCKQLVMCALRGCQSWGD
jgi:hypothetical protein